jgi:aminoglycoside phosphotransferase family enzyme/predicted kinase
MTISDQTEILDFLSRADTFPGEQHPPQRIDTHISCVFLTSQTVYKLKKQLKFDFLDYSTLERRRWACEEEVRLNRRLAPDVYQGVLSVTRETSGQLTLHGLGEPVEWLVQMRRLPEDATLLHHIEAGTVTQHQIRSLSAKLAKFYQTQQAQAQAAPTSLAGSDYLDRLQRYIRDNLKEFARERAACESGVLDAAEIAQIHRRQLRWLGLHPKQLAARPVAGKVVDGHGDLRPEHVYFLPEPVIIDGIEFNAELRQIDVLDELVFLATECEALGAEWIGRQLLDEYRAASQDDYDPALSDFYASYRACVRAKVHCLRARQLPPPEAEESLHRASDYLRIAAKHAERLAGPVLIIVYGLSGTGKSTLAAALGLALRIETLSTDALRQELFADAPPKERYRPENRQRVYDELLQQAGEQLAAGKWVIVDGTFAQASQRQDAIDTARIQGAMVLLVHCQCDPDVALRRIHQRMRRGGSLSEATADVYQQQAHAFAPDDAIEARIVVVDTAREVDENLQVVFQILNPV